MQELQLRTHRRRSEAGPSPPSGDPLQKRDRRMASSDLVLDDPGKEEALASPDHDQQVGADEGRHACQSQARLRNDHQRQNGRCGVRPWRRPSHALSHVPLPVLPPGLLRHGGRRCQSRLWHARCDSSGIRIGLIKWPDRISRICKNLTISMRYVAISAFLGRHVEIVSCQQMVDLKQLMR